MSATPRQPTSADLPAMSRNLNTDPTVERMSSRGVVAHCIPALTLLLGEMSRKPVAITMPDGIYGSDVLGFRNNVQAFRDDAVEATRALARLATSARALRETAGVRGPARRGGRDLVAVMAAVEGMNFAAQELREAGDEFLQNDDLANKTTKLANGLRVTIVPYKPYQVR
jgi:hypothetical protein